MTVTDHFKILNRKILQNEAQYDLDKKVAKISALFSNNLDKYEYLTGEDLGPQPSTVEQAKFEYFPLGKVFARGLDINDQKEGLIKRLKNIENAQKNLISGDDNKSIYYTPRLQFDSEDDEDKDQEKEQNINVGSKPLNVFDYLNGLSQEAKDLLAELEDTEKDLNKKILNFVGSNREKFNVSTFKSPLDFLLNIYHGKITLKEAEFLQESLNEEIKRLKFDYKPNSLEKKKK